ncbi:UNKNOWN [Stylonychia lemnae]|uniref:Leucine Rich Repeat family protein n=1 Tax=Stylonychia lemnae TaxID=5949 RepID=A0A078AMJ6_STYLE|nr:UNKNOWN [Stylonychia lemnae]|eukprot:CDW83610.1 UNKNOWN [Stylonychia lemnae]
MEETVQDQPQRRQSNLLIQDTPVREFQQRQLERNFSPPQKHLSDKNIQNLSAIKHQQSMHPRSTLQNQSTFNKQNQKNGKDDNMEQGRFSIIQSSNLSGKNREDRPKLLERIGQESLNQDKYSNYLDQNNSNLMVYSNHSKKDSFSTLFRFSNKHKQPRASGKSQQEHTRGSNGKFAMKPSNKSIMNIKNSIKVAESVKQKFLYLLGQKNSNYEQPQSQNNLELTDRNQQQDGQTIPETQMINNLTNMDEKGLMASTRKNQARFLSQDLNYFDENGSKLPSQTNLDLQLIKSRSAEKGDDNQRDMELITNINQNLNLNRKKLSGNSRKVNLSAKTSGLSQIKLNPDAQSVLQDKTKCFSFNTRPKEGLFIYANKMINDEELHDFLLTVVDENIAKFSITNGQLTDIGIVILSNFFGRKSNLHVLKLYNNIMNVILSNIEVPLLPLGTISLAQCIEVNTKLTSLELHGFFFHEPDFPLLVDALMHCNNLKNIQFSNNNVLDSGAKQLCRLLEKSHINPIELEQLTIYNNNITDVGATDLATVMQENTSLKILNLQMNFIKDSGAQQFLDGIQNKYFQQIWKIILLDNKCTEQFKKKVKKTEVIII